MQAARADNAPGRGEGTHTNRQNIIKNYLRNRFFSGVNGIKSMADRIIWALVHL